jgi:uncharacterized protein (TIGR03083 family)
MARRPLRQYYDGVTIEEDLGAAVEPWVRHRRRFVDRLAELSDDRWRATTRCTEWDARGLVSHLVTVDGFFVLQLGNARAGAPPTTFLREGFDPSTATDDLVGPLLELSNDVLLERFAAGTDAFVETVERFDDSGWAGTGESPFGHIPARYLLAHSFWDSWLHERDLFVPLGLAPPLERDELRQVAGFSLLFTGLQGGLLDDESPVGPGPEAPIDVGLRFTDLPDDPMHLRIDTGVHLRLGADVTGVTGCAAVDLVESVTGRQPPESVGALPADLRSQLARAVKIL